MKTLIGIVTFGNTAFTRLTVDEIYRTAQRPFDMAVIAGKPGDTETLDWAMAQQARTGMHCMVHKRNKGFTSSLNDIYDFAWARNYGQVIICGNDVVCYPRAIDVLIEFAETTDWEWICASQFNAQSLVQHYPEARKYFAGPTLVFTDFKARPWELHKGFGEPSLEPNVIRDVQNLCLFKRSAFDKVGYFDPNFWPNGYYSDNDACYRAHRCGVKSCVLSQAAYFHFWSRTIHQGEQRPHGKYFERNGEFYKLKWGGGVNAERFALPFDGQPHRLAEGAMLAADLKISHREAEEAVVRYWSSL